MRPGLTGGREISKSRRRGKHGLNFKQTQERLQRVERGRVQAHAAWETAFASELGSVGLDDCEGDESGADRL